MLTVTLVILAIFATAILVGAASGLFDGDDDSGYDSGYGSWEEDVDFDE